MATIDVKCRFCNQTDDVKKHGTGCGHNQIYQRWLWYAWEPRLKRIIAHAFGDRSTETLNVLLIRMKQFNVAF